MKNLANASSVSVLHPVKKCENCKKIRNEQNFEAKLFFELGSYMFALKSYKKFVAKRFGTKTTPNSKKTSKTTPSSGDVPENALLLMFSLYIYF